MSNTARTIAPQKLVANLATKAIKNGEKLPIFVLKNLGNIESVEALKVNPPSEIYSQLWSTLVEEFSESAFECKFVVANITVKGIIIPSNLRPPNGMLNIGLTKAERADLVEQLGSETFEEIDLLDPVEEVHDGEDYMMVTIDPSRIVELRFL